MSKFAWKETPLDLRAPILKKVGNNLWAIKLAILICVDCISLLLAWVWSINSDWSKFRVLILIAICIQILSLILQGAYSRSPKRYDYLNIVKTLTFAESLIVIICFLNEPYLDITKSIVITSWFLSTLFICIGRLSFKMIGEKLRDRKIFSKDYIFIICEPHEEKKIIDFVNNDKRYTIIGTSTPNCLDRFNRINTLKTLNKFGVSETFVSWSSVKNRMFISWLFQSFGITLHILPVELNPIFRDIELTKIAGMPCISFYCPMIIGKDFWIKRSFDFIFTILFLLVTFPIYIIIALLIKLDSPGPIFYKQIRIGLHGLEFKVWKFRTMQINAEALQKQLETLNESQDGILFKIKNDPRITRVGKYLRRYSLDELPQLFNVLLGEMSLIGPRPLPLRDVEKFSERHFIRHEVLPGITGLWQVSGRSDIIDFEQVLNLDLQYIEHWSLWLDCQILWQTLVVVLMKKGAY